MRFCLTLVVCLSSIVSVRAGDDWPQFRGPTGDGHSPAKNLPTRWSETENIVWKTPIHDKGWSSPVIRGDQIWMTTALATGKEFFAVCVDRKSGKIVHDIKVFTEEKPAFCHEYNSYASPTPIIENDRVYVHFGAHGTACLDTTSGKILWEQRELKCDHFRGPGSSPFLYGNLIILTFDGFDVQYLAALDKNTGKTVWRKDRGIKYPNSNGDLRKAYSTPSILKVAGKDQLVSPSAEATISYDPLTGDENWRITHGGMNAAGKPVFGHDLMFLTSGHTAQLIAVKQGGKGELAKDQIAWKWGRNVPSRPSLLLVDDLLYFVDDAGVGACLEAKTGKQLWTERLGGRTCASPVYANGMIYVFDEDGKGTVVATGPDFKKIATNQLNAGCMASPAIAGDQLFVRTKTHLYCIGTQK